MAAHWIGLIEGRENRQDIRAWAAQWVEAIGVDVADPMVDMGLLRLHGFNTTRRSGSNTDSNQGCEYIHSDDAVTNGYDKWVRDCARFDADPDGYLAEKREAALAYREQEKRRRRDEI